MKFKNKALLLTVCALLLVAATVFGTLAWLTDSELVTNTFTVGKVTLGDDENEEKGLDEAAVNAYGEVQGTNRVLKNTYKLIPGHTYTKDPTVHVKNDSEDSYIFVKVSNGIAGIEAATETAEGGYQSIADQIKANGWQELPGHDGVYWQKWTKGAETTGTTDLVVFEKFEINAETTVETLNTYADVKLTVTAYAIQADGFDTVAEAWAKVPKQ